MGNLLDRKQLLSKEELEVRRVDLGKDEYVFVRQMTGRERDIFEQSLIKEKKGSGGVPDSFEKSLEDFRAKLAVVTLCDEQGVLLLQARDYATLSMNMGYARLEKIVIAAQELNKIAEEEKELILKNSDAGETGSSTSDSVSN